ncbi:MAG: ABC transporter ATP-binding protein [Thermoprotei archaeon]|nr:ABC transporter ATP-binding protein [TACK group archaeon]
MEADELKQYAVVLENVKKVYGGAVPTYALKGINLRIRRGEFVSVVGPSGSGKSTLLNIMGVLDRPTEGKVYVGGIDVLSLPDSKLSYARNKYIGFVFQSYNLINRLTVLQNVELPLMIRGMSKLEMEARAMKSLEMVGVATLANKKPNALSGGQQQRVAIARALVTEPEFILADEPTGNLDTTNSLMIMDLLKAVNREAGRSIVMVTHNMELAKMTHRIIHIRDGLIESDERLGRDP